MRWPAAPRWLAPLLLVVALLLAWELASRLGLLRLFLFPPPSKLARTFSDLAFDGFPEGILLWSHVGVTLRRIALGFVVALALAVPLGALIGRVAWLDRMTAPVVAFCRSVATLSLLPLALAWFGSGEATKVFLIGYGCFWVMLASTIAAIKYVDPVLVRAARTMDTRPASLFFRVVLPAALPRIVSGARVALGVGFTVIVGAEMIGTVQGLGALIMQARTFYRSDITMVGMLVIGVIGFGLSLLLALLENRLLPWQARLAEHQG
jgi:ABC-type nitrate/sulfonate/bicarbonate transport system permease component